MRTRALLLSMAAAHAGVILAALLLPVVKAAPADGHTLHVSASDQRGRYITGFSKDMFTVTSGKETLEITSFSQNEPAEVLILIDRSKAMFDFYRRIGSKESFFHELMSIFLENANPASAYSVIAFNNTSQPLIDGTSDKHSLLSSIKNLEALRSDKPKTVYDDCHYAVEKLSQSSRKKRVLLVFTKPIPDGGSKNNAKKLRDAAKMNNVLIFTVAIADQAGPVMSHEQMAAFDTLGDITPSTGGKSFFPMSSEETMLIFGGLGEELRHQYTLGIKFSETTGANKWRSIKVQIDPPKGIAKFMVRNQEEFFVQ